MKSVNVQMAKSSSSVVSLFTGCGGLDLGFHEAGFKSIYAADNDPAAIAVYRHNIGPLAHVRDVTTEKFHTEISGLGQADVVLGGFPCQGFSKAGPKRETDKRNVLYLEMRRTIAELKPRIFIAENVDGLSQNFGGAYLRAIVEDFTKVGYRVDHRIIDAVAFGVPQHRRRLLFVGVRNDLPDFEWPTSTHLRPTRNGESIIEEPTPSLWESSGERLLQKAVSIKEALAHLPRSGADKDHRVTNSWPEKYTHIFKAIGPGQKLCNVRHAPSSVYTWQIPEVFGHISEKQRRILETIGRNRRHKKYGTIPNGNPLGHHDIASLMESEVDPREIQELLALGYLKEMDGKYDLKGAMFCSGLFKRPLWNGQSPTVLTNFHNPRYFLHPKEDRPFTLRECARLQGFPDTFKFTDAGVSLEDGYRLVGNAVPPPISRAFAQAVADFLKLSNSQTQRFSVLLKHQEQTLDQKVWEFDFWVTPSIVDIRATDRFKLEMQRVLGVLDALSVGGHKELDSRRFAADLVDRTIAHLNLYDAVAHEPLSFKEYSEEFLTSLAALLFLVTGKSDNNNKCQFPIYLQVQSGWDSIPTLKSKGKKKTLATEGIPRIIDSEAYMARVARMHVASMEVDSDPALQGVASKLLLQFVASLLGDESSRNQLTAYLRHYSSSMDAKKDPTVLLTPLVMFQVRGSVAASGGHEPEEILRDRMTDWGMIRAIDFNTKDVILDSEAGAIFEERGEEQEKKRDKTKTRAYDFALPFRTPTWHPMIFVQSQFYAGDSGSVSHKNVDQTSSSRVNASRYTQVP